MTLEKYKQKAESFRETGLYPCLFCSRSASFSYNTSINKVAAGCPICGFYIHKENEKSARYWWNKIVSQTN